jgi:Ni,Fe-hydrogenase III large subunit
MKDMEERTPDVQLDLLPREGIDWSRTEPIRRIWLEDVGGDQGARLEFLADQGLRLIMADLGPDGGETLHFFNPRDCETLHLRAGGGKSLLPESSRYFPAASRWIELLYGEGDRKLDMHLAGSPLPRDGLLLQVEGGRIQRVFEAWMDFPQVVLCGAKAGQAGALLEEDPGMDGMVLTLTLMQALEDARGMKVPAAALALRVVLLESWRAQSHLAWLASAASSLGRKRVEEKCAVLRQDLETGMQKWLDDPLGRGWMVPGGVRDDFPLEVAGDFCARLAAAAGSWQELAPRVTSLPVPRWIERKSRCLEGEAEKSGWVGPLARAAGSDVDARKEEPVVYEAAAWESGGIPGATGIMRRMLAVRAAEISSSLEVMQRILGEPPDTPLLVKRGRGGRGEGFGRCEGPEGETCCHVALEKGRISFISFSRPRELNRSAARILEGCRLDEMEILSMLW